MAQARQAQRVDRAIAARERQGEPRGRVEPRTGHARDHRFHARGRCVGGNGLTCSAAWYWPDGSSGRADAAPLIYTPRTSETADVPRTTKQPHDQHYDENNPEYSTNSIATPAIMVAASVISKATLEL